MPVRVRSRTPNGFIKSRNAATLPSSPVTSMVRLLDWTSTILARKISVICITSARVLESTLTFASTTGVTTGMIAVAANIPANAFVLAVTSTTVILDQAVSADVPAATAITFATFGSYPSGSADGDVAHIDLIYNGTYAEPGLNDSVPVSAVATTTWANSPSYTVAGATLTVSPTTPGGISAPFNRPSPRTMYTHTTGGSGGGSGGGIGNGGQGGGMTR